MSDYISKSALLKNLLDWRLQECPVGVCDEETETYKTICECIKAVEEQPTISETEIIRKAFERVVEKMESELKWTRAEQSIECTRRNGYGSPLQSKNSGKIEALKKAISIVKEECGISE